ncbi:MAG: exodeoxyribonuclease VII small subunit [Clostridiales bacterium]|nr:exodeoxyribonuclease VII small subunit [Clostridiales bacterium]
MSKEIKLDDDLTFEKAIDQLNELVKKLNEGKASLDDSLYYYQYGTALVDFCNKKLTEVRQQIEIVNTASGNTENLDI